MAEQALPIQKVMHPSSSEQPAAKESLLTWCWGRGAAVKKLVPCLRQHQLWHHSSFRAPHRIELESVPFIGSSRPWPTQLSSLPSSLRALVKEITHQILSLSPASREPDLSHYYYSTHTHTHTHTCIPEINFQKQYLHLLYVMHTDTYSLCLFNAHL